MNNMDTINKALTLQILRENILNFWIRHMTDPEGGFYGRMDGSGRLHKQADRSVILNSRILWTFSAAYRSIRQEEYKELADHAYDYLIRHFLDEEYGGVYWMLNAKGKATQDKKQVYAQAFAIYALSEYSRITASQEPLGQAKKIYDLLEEYAFDPKHNGYYEAFDRKWHKLEDVRLSEKDMNATKTMNTHLHVLEAYTGLYRCWPDPQLKRQLTGLIRLMSTRFLDPQYHFHLFFNTRWDLLSGHYSYGHDIEGSWLLCEAAEAVGDAGLLRDIEQLALKMTDAAMEGLDEDGGLMNEGQDGQITDTDKHWWPQAEALVGLANAWRISGDEQYLGRMTEVWQFVETRLLDPWGEWHWKVSREGVIDFSEDKAGPWKCPYHNGRAMLELNRRLTY